LDSALLARPGNDEIQLDLFLDYASNVALYPQFQAYFRKAHPPLLAVWGRNDPFFLPPGAEAFKRDNPNAEVRLYDAGHFALRPSSRRSRPTSAVFWGARWMRTGNSSEGGAHLAAPRLGPADRLRLRCPPGPRDALASTSTRAWLRREPGTARGKATRRVFLGCAGR
jgi:hypothetical protein